MLHAALLAAAAALLPQDPPKADGDDAWFAKEDAVRCAAAAERGLRWLERQQLPTGCWVGYVGHKVGDDYEVLLQALLPEAQARLGRGHLGVTALCGMAFLAGGSLPDRGPFAAVVQRTVAYMQSTAQENGYLTDSGTRMYSHAFATLFLAEVYGADATAATKDALERAVNLIVDSQNELGGWRYNPFDRELDLSVTVCQVQALRAARNIGLRVPAQSIDRAMDYVRQSRVPRGPYAGLFYYKIHGRGQYEKPAEYAINAAALTALRSAGVHDDDLSDPVLTFLDAEYPRLQQWYADHYFYWYGNYYAAQAYYQSGGPRLRRWFARLSADLLASQEADGRWRNRTGPGDPFATAVACILLQMPRQYLPIFQR
jgi:hypothetical protein